MRYPWIFGLFFFLCACVGYSVPRPPEYSEACEPTHDYYYRMAHSTQDMIPLHEIPKDPQEALDLAKQKIGERGIEILQKGEGDPTHMFTTTLPGQIYLAYGFDESDAWLQAATLWHELVHVNQWERMGEDSFVEHYAFPDGRLALETPAYRQTFMVLRHFGAQEEKLLPFQQKTFDALYEGYGLGIIPRECAEKMTFEVWGIDNG